MSPSPSATPRATNAETTHAIDRASSTALATTKRNISYPPRPLLPDKPLARPDPPAHPRLPPRAALCGNLHLLAGRPVRKVRCSRGGGHGAERDGVRERCQWCGVCGCAADVGGECRARYAVGCGESAWKALRMRGASTVSAVDGFKLLSICSDCCSSHLFLAIAGDCYVYSYRGRNALLVGHATRLEHSVL
ncbi:hypothetical protein MRB53_039822 [Persea americana]|nr:hypothetical protein MRB53_039822 [Persea americana]